VSGAPVERFITAGKNQRKILLVRIAARQRTRKGRETREQSRNYADLTGFWDRPGESTEEVETGGS
jgi:hypothetical protein